MFRRLSRLAASSPAACGPGQSVPRGRCNPKPAPKRRKAIPGRASMTSVGPGRHRLQIGTCHVVTFGRADFNAARSIAFHGHRATGNPRSTVRSSPIRSRVRVLEQNIRVRLPLLEKLLHK